MALCEAIAFYPKICNLVEKCCYSEPTEKDIRSLAKIVRKWQQVDCPEDSCNSACLYAQPLQCLEYLGYVDLFSLLNSWDTDKEYKVIPKHKASLDPLERPWAKRPGHYNP